MLQQAKTAFALLFPSICVCVRGILFLSAIFFVRHQPFFPSGKSFLFTIPFLKRLWQQQQQQPKLLLLLLDFSCLSRECCCCCLNWQRRKEQMVLGPTTAGFLVYGALPTNVRNGETIISFCLGCCPLPASPQSFWEERGQIIVVVCH